MREMISLDIEVDRATQRCNALDREYGTGEVERIANEILERKRRADMEEKMVLPNKVLGSIKRHMDEETQ